MEEGKLLPKSGVRLRELLSRFLSLNRALSKVGTAAVAVSPTGFGLEADKGCVYSSPAAVMSRSCCVTSHFK